ncbi:YsnF/AvaK domain-containing protein [Pontibacter sp. BT731]|uniref:YsnF/AvaK domain-containing protein n=1 Tax=Pontibacter coccineus TaxID=3063328 RepID=UPI0026E2771E|nr:YsnF/AvaK domain-containing protein [Pontibacter sp. BT731]MDO6391191.1 YsnF/AvaK domain-containing protein [Pontibacter sp. BT731]
MERQTVIGIFKEGIDAQAAVQKLESTHHIGRDKVDIANPASASAKHVGSSTTNRDNDSVSGFFGSLFGQNDDASKHTQAARKGWVVTVHADSRQEAEQAAAVLDSCGAVDVDETASPQAGMNRPPQDTTQTRTGQTGDSSQTIPIMEERLNVGKREVERGGVHMRSRIVERPVEEHLRLREEHLDIERNKVNRPATDRDFQNFKEGEINITERAEVPVVNKEARVVEEVKISKHTEERDETVRGTVRKTDVDIDKQDRNRDQDLRNPGNKPGNPRNI